jgi:hypothetical protein
MQQTGFDEDQIANPPGGAFHAWRRMRHSGHQAKRHVRADMDLAHRVAVVVNLDGGKAIARTDDKLARNAGLTARHRHGHACHCQKQCQHDRGKGGQQTVCHAV